MLGWCHSAYDLLHKSGHECLMSVCVQFFVFCFFFTSDAKAPNASMHAITHPRAKMELL